VVHATDTTCQKCGNALPREEVNCCAECNHPFSSIYDRFCQKCKAPRPLSDNQCDCGQFFENGDESQCKGCGMMRWGFDEVDQTKMLDSEIMDEQGVQLVAVKEKDRKQKMELKRMERASQGRVAEEALRNKKEWREKARMSIARIDNLKQEEEDKKKAQAAVWKSKSIEKMKIIPQGTLNRAINDSDEIVAVSVLTHDAFLYTNVRDSRGCTTLHCAAERGLTTVCRTLLMRADASDATRKDNENWSALHRAAKNGHALACKCLCSHPAFHSASMIRGRDGFTALHCAALHGFVDTVKVLLNHPQFLHANAKDVWGRTALHHAASYGHAEVVTALLEHPRFATESIDALTKWGTSANDVAIGRARQAMEERHRIQQMKADNSDALGSSVLNRTGNGTPQEQANIKDLFRSSICLPAS